MALGGNDHKDITRAAGEATQPAPSSGRSLSPQGRSLSPQGGSLSPQGGSLSPQGGSPRSLPPLERLLVRLRVDRQRRLARIVDSQRHAEGRGLYRPPQGGLDRPPCEQPWSANAGARGVIARGRDARGRDARGGSARGSGTLFSRGGVSCFVSRFVSSFVSSFGSQSTSSSSYDCDGWLCRGRGDSEHHVGRPRPRRHDARETISFRERI